MKSSKTNTKNLLDTASSKWFMNFVLEVWLTLPFKDVMEISVYLTNDKQITVKKKYICTSQSIREIQNTSFNGIISSVKLIYFSNNIY